MARTKTPGIRQRGSSWEAWVFDRRANDGKGKKMYRTFGSYAAAKQWRLDAASQVHKGTMRAPLPITVREACEAWLEGAGEGQIRTRKGEPYKPAVLRNYKSVLNSRVIPQFGAARLADLRRVDLQDFAGRMLADGLDPSTIRGTLMPLRSVIRRALQRDELHVDPFAGLELPSPEGKRDRIADPAEAEKLLAVIPERHRALWATAFYAGLRRGELMGLTWENVAADKITVARSWDEVAGPIAPKSKAGVRTVPVPKVLTAYLNRHKLLTGRREGLVFGVSAAKPFTASNIRLRALGAWGAENQKRVKENPKAGLLLPIALHECRHTYASLMIAAGVNIKALSTYMGHSSVTITLDRYGHLLPGNEDEAAQLFDTYLERKLAANGAATGASALQSV